MTRNDLIEAAARILRDGWIGTDDAGIVFPDEARVVGEDIMSALLPLIADAIEARREFWGRPGGMALDDAAAVVRSLASAVHTEGTET